MGLTCLNYRFFTAMKINEIYDWYKILNYEFFREKLKNHQKYSDGTVPSNFVK